MKIAVPTAGGRLAMHFGHCDQFTIVDIENNEIVKTESHTPPPHEPGVLPAWLGELGVNVIIAGGMGQRAQQLFAMNDINVLVGAPADPVEDLVNAYIKGNLVSGVNVCDH